jgi:hypothetical protein
MPFKGEIQQQVMQPYFDFLPSGTSLAHQLNLELALESYGAWFL